VRHLWPQRIIRIRIRQQRQNGQQHLRNGERRRPLAFENIEADDAARIDIRMIDLRRKRDLRGLKRIIVREVDVDAKEAAGER